MTSRDFYIRAALALAVAAVAGSSGCDANRRIGATNAGGGGSSAGGSSGDAGGLFGGSGGGGGTGPLKEEPSCEGVDPNKDNDGDGWSGAQGDCNDCTPQMNPGAQDYPDNNIDEDCNGTKDDTGTDCDASIDVESADPMDGARAMGLCRVAQNDAWGVVSAQYITADGQPLEKFDSDKIGWGILPDFGPNVKPQEGKRVLALSSGTARRPVDPGYDSPGGHNKMYTTGSPPGYPKPSPACPDIMAGEPHDSAGLRLVIKTPTNAKSLSFNFDFYTYEFPKYICDVFNDFFVAMLSPKPANQSDGNISYDSKGNTISVNAGFLQVCHPQTASNNAFFDCQLGPGQLQGTGFELDTLGVPSDNSAATGWLQTTTPVDKPGGTVTLDFAIWDSGDGYLDSTVLVDNFQFGLDDTPTETKPIPDPK